jgi:hypothetical protein
MAMAKFGNIIAIIGLVGVIYFSILYMQDTNTFTVLGMDVATSTGDYVPIFISAGIMIAGVFLRRAPKK